MAQNLIYPAETTEIKGKELTYLDTNRGEGEKYVSTTYKLGHQPR